MSTADLRVCMMGRHSSLGALQCCVSALIFCRTVRTFSASNHNCGPYPQPWPAHNPSVLAVALRIYCTSFCHASSGGLLAVRCRLVTSYVLCTVLRALHAVTKVDG